MKLIRASVNVSEGTDLSVVEEVRKALMLNNEVELIDVNPDKDHNRTVYVYKGEPRCVLEATKRLAKRAVELIDMTKHKGSHPRLGAVDVVPFTMVQDVTTEEAVELIREFGKYLGSLGVPVYYYEDAATSPDRRSLVDVRRGQYEGLAERIKAGFLPDEGPKEFVPKCGATVAGVRFPLVALNVNLDTEDIEIGKKIVKAIRGASGGYQNVRAIALPIPDEKAIQVSMNLIQYEKTPIHRVFETIKSEAARYGVLVKKAELGSLPMKALEETVRFYLQAHDFTVDSIY
jgi:glutamate formiminotransferase